MSNCPPSLDSACPPGQALPEVIADYTMPVEGTGIIFVVALPARIALNGILLFQAQHTQFARWHAAADLGDMGLIHGATLRFMREAVPWTSAELATFLGVSEPEVLDWESGIASMSRDPWFSLAEHMRKLAGEYGPNTSALQVPDFRSRTIRFVLPMWGLRRLGP
jgi:hypothetical protein